MKSSQPLKDAKSGAEGKSSGFDTLKKTVGSYFVPNVIMLAVLGYYDVLFYQFLCHTGEQAEYVRAG